MSETYPTDSNICDHCGKPCHTKHWSPADGILGCDRCYVPPALSGDDETIAGLLRELAAAHEATRVARMERGGAIDVLRAHGFVECDIPACNCGSWHHRYGLPKRMAEINDALAAAGYPLSNENGHLTLRALEALIAENERLRKALEEQ